eukprot:CAMPEP_0113320846 /NCGR_PEP_ID=MMETSP0010_2-20120614/14529_1 /TAXON_ID=216773 ORGANISM="Corethron hystrix, Strain 308" /NCGR_SAMPLE_ID=MMETSP0010_2 /ASSEMBLY_ACC=CAM_ASM_000155 /LENGTH=121 /DNA_ID=CAMNT_0000178785 /DNA_START=517 /DNA_END=879 /DNA_ORIENTATION=+ /assembly_acc=CAM_ASM_000155
MAMRSAPDASATSSQDRGTARRVPTRKRRALSLSPPASSILWAPGLSVLLSFRMLAASVSKKSCSRSGEILQMQDLSLMPSKVSLPFMENSYFFPFRLSLLHLTNLKSEMSTIRQRRTRYT